VSGIAQLDLRPAPGRAPVARIILRQARMEIRLSLRRADATVITLVVPLFALLGVGCTSVIRLPGTDRLGYVVPGVLALATTATAFTAPAITTAYERSFGVLKRLGASALSTSGMVTAKAVAVVLVTAAETAVLAAVGAAVGWHPRLAGLPAAAALVLLATVAFTGFALLLAGRLRPETTTGAANLLYLLFLVGGGLLFPLPANGLRVLPTTALAEGLRAALSTGSPVPVLCWNVLTLWAVVGVMAAVRGFRWQ
jgi:ABC-2 type transport system permease protein